MLAYEKQVGFAKLLKAVIHILCLKSAFLGEGMFHRNNFFPFIVLFYSHKEFLKHNCSTKKELRLSAQL